jgi:phosphatidyl-myo-inositol alpha-mannosyltransferase
VRVALLIPTYWPEVRRGSERLVHDLGQSLALRGHEVAVLTTHHGPSSSSTEDGVRIVRARRPPQAPERMRLEFFVTNAPQMLGRLLRGKFDVVHSFSVADGWAAVNARRFGAPPVIHSLHGLPGPASLQSRRGRTTMVRTIGRKAAATSVLSEAAAGNSRRYLGIDPLILPGGVRQADFLVAVPRAAEPMLFCPASIGDPRKRVQVLLTAFPSLRARRPGIRLVLTEGRDPILSRRSVTIPKGVEVVPVDDTGRLAELYAQAWVTVLPSVDEAFGLVLVESLAAGTPVVAARSGASPEIVRDGSVGRLFTPDDENDLIRAIDETLDLASGAGTRDACRIEAERHDWSNVVAEYETAYRAALVT